MTTAHSRAQEELETRRRTATFTVSTPSDSGGTVDGLLSAENDPASFIANLDPDLRRQILSDLDDETISRLPGELATEARTLQQEIQDR